MNFANNIEQWMLIDFYDNYEVSSFGRVRNNVTARILKPQLNKHGYQGVNIYKDGKVKNHAIHRLVAFAFCPNPNEYNTVDHISRIKTNNMFNNLRWTTDSENSRNTSINKNNTSETQGICKHTINNNDYWVAQWYDNDKKQRSKYFSINNLGGDQAKAHAIEFRRQREIEFGYLN